MFAGMFVIIFVEGMIKVVFLYAKPSNLCKSIFVFLIIIIIMMIIVIIYLYPGEKLFKIFKDL